MGCGGEGPQGTNSSRLPKMSSFQAEKKKCQPRGWTWRSGQEACAGGQQHAHHHLTAFQQGSPPHCWCLALSLPRSRTSQFPWLKLLGLLPWQGMSLGRQEQPQAVTPCSSRDLGDPFARLHRAVQAVRRAEPRDMGTEGAVGRRRGVGR